MTAMVKKIVYGWSVTLDGDEPRVLDEELGRRLGFARPRDIRKLIERPISDGILNDSDIRATVARVVESLGLRRLLLPTSASKPLRSVPTQGILPFPGAR